MIPRATRLKQRTPQTIQQVILADTPLAYWPCNDAFGSASMADASGNARTMTLNGSRTLNIGTKNARMGRGVAMVQGSGYGSIAAAAWHQLTGDMTCECWIKTHFPLASGEGMQWLFCNVDGETTATNSLYQFAYQNNGGTRQLAAFHETGAGVNVSTTINYTIPDETKWNHIAVVRDATALTYSWYVNGAFVGATAAYSANPTGGTSSVLGLNRGQAGPTFSTYATSFAHVALYSTKLSATRIKEHYRAGSRANLNDWEKNVVLLARFNGADAAVAAADESSYGRILTFNGNAQLDTAQFKSGVSSLLLDGTGDYITAANTERLQIIGKNFTIEAWIRLSTTGKAMTVTNKRDAASAEEHTISIDGTTNLLSFSAFNGGSAIVSLVGTTVLTTGQWYHVAATRSGNNWYLHIDGVLEDSDTTASAASTNTGVFHIGRDGFNTGRDFQGWIDSVRFDMDRARYGASNFTPPAVFEPYV